MQDIDDEVTLIKKKTKSILYDKSKYLFMIDKDFSFNKKDYIFDVNKKSFQENNKDEENLFSDINAVEFLEVDLPENNIEKSIFEEQSTINETNVEKKIQEVASEITPTNTIEESILIEQRIANSTEPVSSTEVNNIEQKVEPIVSNQEQVTQQEIPSVSIYEDNYRVEKPMINETNVEEQLQKVASQSSTVNVTSNSTLDEQKMINPFEQLKPIELNIVELPKEITVNSQNQEIFSVDAEETNTNQKSNFNVNSIFSEDDVEKEEKNAPDALQAMSTLEETQVNSHDINNDTIKDTDNNIEVFDVNG